MKPLCICCRFQVPPKCRNKLRKGLIGLSNPLKGSYTSCVLRQAGACTLLHLALPRKAGTPLSDTEAEFYQDEQKISEQCKGLSVRRYQAILFSPIPKKNITQSEEWDVLWGLLGKFVEIPTNKKIILKMNT